MHRFSMPVQLAFDLSLPLIRVRLDALIGQFFVNLKRRVVKSEFNNREIRRCGFEVIAQPQASQLEFRLIEVGKRVAEVHQHQVALVADQREKCGLAAGFLFHFAQHRRRFLSNRRSRALGQGSPGRPTETHHLVQYAVALGGQRHFRNPCSGGLRLDGRSRGRGHWVLRMCAHLDSASIVRKMQDQRDARSARCKTSESTIYNHAGMLDG